MDLMDLDLEFDRDRIQDFLENKLQRLQLSNSNLEKTISDRKEILKQQSDGLDSELGNGSVILLGEMWTRINNNKCIFGVTISNTSESTLRDPVVLLNIVPDIPSLRYKCLLLPEPLLTGEEGLKWSTSLAISTHLLIVMDVPTFIDHLDYTFSASVAFHNDNVRLNLPPVKISSDDITDNVVLVKTYKVIEGVLEDCLASAVSNEKYEFNVLLPLHWDRSLDATLETYCSLKRVNLHQSSNIENAKMFLVHNISRRIDGSLIEVVGNKLMNIYAKDDESVVTLLHHLHRHLINVAIIPKTFYNRCLFENVHDDGQELRKLLLREHEFMRERVLKQSDLAQLQHDTDLFLLKVNKTPKSNTQVYN